MVFSIDQIDLEKLWQQTSIPQTVVRRILCERESNIPQRLQETEDSRDLRKLYGAMREGDPFRVAVIEKLNQVLLREIDAADCWPKLLEALNRSLEGGPAERAAMTKITTFFLKKH